MLNLHTHSVNLHPYNFVRHFASPAFSSPENSAQIRFFSYRLGDLGVTYAQHSIYSSLESPWSTSYLS